MSQAMTRDEIEDAIRSLHNYLIYVYADVFFKVKGDDNIRQVAQAGGVEMYKDLVGQSLMLTIILTPN